MSISPVYLRNITSDALSLYVVAEGDVVPAGDSELVCRAWRIYRHGGADLGVFGGEDERAAVDAMLRGIGREHGIDEPDARVEDWNVWPALELAEDVNPNEVVFVVAPDADGALHAAGRRDRDEVVAELVAITVGGESFVVEAVVA